MEILIPDAESYLGFKYEVNCIRKFFFAACQHLDTYSPQLKKTFLLNAYVDAHMGEFCKND